MDGWILDGWIDIQIDNLLMKELIEGLMINKEINEDVIMNIL